MAKVSKPDPKLNQQASSAEYTQPAICRYRSQQICQERFLCDGA